MRTFIVSLVISIGLVVGLGASSSAFAQSITAAPIPDAGAVLVEPFDAGIAPSVTVNAGSGSTVTVSPAATLPNPAEHPVQAWDEVKAAKKTSWPLLVWACLAMLGKALAYSRDKVKGWPVIGKAAAWLSVGKRAMVVAGIGTVGTAGYDVLLAGGSVVAALIASGIALAGITHSTTKGAPQPETVKA